MNSYEKVELSSDIQCFYAGAYYIGIKAIRLTDPFQIFNVTLEIPWKHRAIVQPQISDLASQDLEIENIIQNMGVKSEYRFEEIPGSDNRPYVRGDSLHSINWKVSARLNELTVRLPDKMEKKRITLVLLAEKTSDDSQDIEFLKNRDSVLIVSNPAEEDETAGTNADIKDSLLHILTIVGVVIGSMAAILALIIIGTFLYRKLRYHFADNDARVKMDVEQIKKSLVKRGTKENIQIENTAMKGSQIDDNHIINERGLLYDYLALAPQEERDKLKRAFDLYYRSIYGNTSKRRISDEQSLFVQEVCREICTDKQ